MNEHRLLELRSKLIARMGPGRAVFEALEIIAEHFNIPTSYVECTNCNGAGRIPYKDSSVPCPTCYSSGQMKITTWMDSNDS
jgi:hypothetical protein